MRFRHFLRRIDIDNLKEIITVGYRVDNDEVWSMVKDGKVKGVSIEGNFEHSFSKNKQDEYLLEEIINILNQIK